MMRSIWVIATNTIKQILRMKVAFAFIVLLLVLLPVMGTAMTGDGTMKGRLQTFVSYSLSLTSILLCLLTIIISIYTLTDDIKHRQIYTVLTKPVRRFQLILGKLLGVVFLNAVLLFLFSSLIYGITIYMPKFFETPDAELAVLDNEFYTARASVLPAQFNVEREVEKAYEKLKKQGSIPAGVSPSAVKANLSDEKRLEKRSVAVGHELFFDFHNVKQLGPDEKLFVRFKYDVSVNPPDLQVYGRWFVGDYRQIKYVDEIKTGIYTFERKDLIRTFYEIEVPADAVAADGYLTVGFYNDPGFNDTVVIFPPKDGIELLYKAGDFTGNFARAVLLILFRLIFLACLGMLASSFLSFPVAILLCLVVFFTGTMSNFVIDSFDYLNENISGIYSFTLKPAIRLLPQFDKFNPSKFLVPGRLLSWFLVAQAAALMVCLKSFLLLIFAMIIFSYREIAKIIV